MLGILYFPIDISITVLPSKQKWQGMFALYLTVMYLLQQSQRNDGSSCGNTSPYGASVAPQCRLLQYPFVQGENRNKIDFSQIASIEKRRGLARGPTTVQRETLEGLRIVETLLWYATYQNARLTILCQSFQLFPFNCTRDHFIGVWSVLQGVIACIWMESNIVRDIPWK